MSNVSRTPLTPPQQVPEWRTWMLSPTVYAAWLIAVVFYNALGHIAGSVLLMLATCWFTSLQHALIHGHPCRNRHVNRLMGVAPLAVWYPYDLYRHGHLAHHRDELLTEPGIDPESNDIDDAAWRRLSRFVRPL